MELDYVHDIQGAYREVLTCMSRPGRIGSIEPYSRKVDLELHFSKALFMMMAMLLDGEVTFAIVSPRAEEASRLTNQLTYGKCTGFAEADYIFVLADADPKLIEQAFQQAKVGDLIDPHKSATMILEAQELSDQPELNLTGPGIETKSSVGVSMKASWLLEREKKNREYPLGIDMIFIDGQAHVMCLPRTTQIVNRSTSASPNAYISMTMPTGSSSNRTGGVD